MQTIKINATPRQQNGKGGARRVRDTGKIPAIAYGKNLAALPLAVSPEQLHQVLASERGRNSVVEIEVEGKDKFTALLCDYQYHPLSRAFLHADFLQIQLDQEVDVDVALELTGKPAGVVLGGTLRQVFRVLPLRCLPEKIPVKITHDITALGLDGHVQVRDLALPEGVKARLPPERTLVAIVKEKQAPEEEAQAGAPAAAAAPAAGGKADAAPAAAEKKTDKK
jgi:large subunit ribosomal protein L25